MWPGRCGAREALERTPPPLFSFPSPSASLSLTHRIRRRGCRLIKEGERMKAMTKAIIFLIAATLLSACATTAPQDSMQADVEQAAAIIERFEAIPERAIPPAVMRAARGLAILTVTKAGFIGSARGGTGVVVARTGNGWSGPSAIGTGGLGVGFQAGVEVSTLRRQSTRSRKGETSPLAAPWA